MNDTDMSDTIETTEVSPDEAFNTLGNEVRIRILRTLGESDGPIGFTELRRRIDEPDSGNFNYHLSKLEDHFVRKTDDGYELRQAGERVIQAVLSGVVTEAPVLESTQIEQSCPYCGAPIEVGFREERLVFYCTECAGLFESVEEEVLDVEEYGRLGALPFPPAGLKGRKVIDVVEAAWVWGHIEVLSISCGVCPRCSATLDLSVNVCEAHDVTNGICEECGRRYGAHLHICCTNCILDLNGAFTLRLMANTDLLAFLINHDINPLTTYEWVTATYHEEILSTNPFKAQFTFTIDDDSLTLTVDDDLNVVDVERSGQQ